MIFKPSGKIYLSLTLILIAAGLAFIYVKKDYGTWICQNGEWVMEGKTGASKPTTACSPVQTTANTDAENTTYTIEGVPITLKNGQAQTPAATGSAEQLTTKIFQANTIGDINGDGQPDTIVILTQSGAGSGTFYYAAAAIKTAEGYQGTNAILMGDRIAPQTSEVKDGQVIVNFADRNPGEDFSVQPSLGKSLYLNFVNNSLVVKP